MLGLPAFAHEVLAEMPVGGVEDTHEALIINEKRMRILCRPATAVGICLSWLPNIVLLSMDFHRGG